MVENKAEESLEGVKVIHSEEYMKSWFLNNGKSNFALPDMQGNAPMHPGQGPGLSLHDLGEIGGSETVTLLQ